MSSFLLLSSLITVTHPPGWSEPMTTIDNWTLISEHRERIEVTGTDTLHQVWHGFDGDPRVGYKAYRPDGTVIFSETMVSNDIWSAYPSSCIVNEDSVALFWREGASVWFSLRDNTGSELIPATLLFPEPYVTRPTVEASSDSLGRIHCVFEISAGVCYAVFDPGTGEMFKDTIPGSYHEASNICVDGNRVHIYYSSGFEQPAYIQYNLSGNIIVPPVDLVTDLDFLSPQSSVAVDNDGNFWCLLRYTVQGEPYSEPHVLKVDGATGTLLLEKEVGLPDAQESYANICPAENGGKLYLMWIAHTSQAEFFVYFAILDKEGNFIEEPYPAYDYSDEEVQNLTCLEATINADGDVYAIWSQGDVQVGGYWIVLGWLDHNWVGVEESETAQVTPTSLSLTCSLNPFEESVIISFEGAQIPEQLMIYDTSGRLVRRLHCSGEESFLWDGRNSQGEEVPSGCYTVRAVSDTELKSLTIVKTN